MSVFTTCPVATALTNIPNAGCEFNMAQIQKLVFTRLYNTTGVLNGFDLTTKPPATLASWTPLLTAADNTKIVTSPFLQNPALEAGAEKTFGGGNATLNGIPKSYGREASKFSGEFHSLKQSVIEAIKKLQTEELGVFMVNEFGQVFGLNDTNTTPTKFLPIPIKSLFIQDLTGGGFESPDMNKFNFSLLPNWSDRLTGIVPTFDALTALNVA